MNILVIGNGFDLAHHMSTQYSDFLGFDKAFNCESNSDYACFIMEIKESNDGLYSEIKSLIENNILLEYFLSIYDDRCKNGKNGWIDFESEISTIVRNLDEAKQYTKEKYAITNEAVKLEKGMALKLKPIILTHKELASNDIITEHSYKPYFFDYQAKCVLDSLNRLTRLLEIYLYDYIEKKKCCYRLPDIKGITFDRVLSFNYTHTFWRYYDLNKKAQYCYIHGEAKNSNIETCNLVLGIDEYLTSERKDSDNEFVWFKKFYQRILKGTGSEYLDWINHFEDFNDTYKKGKPSHLDLYIYGHSLDVTDKDVLSRLILMENCTTHIFYHTRDALAKQINNLVKIIGEENLIRMTSGKGRIIQFIPSQPATKDESAYCEQST